MAVDEWVREYNEDRPHQGIGGSVPWERFRLSQTDQPLRHVVEAAEVLDREPGQVPVTRLVSANETIGFGAQRYLAARWLSGETVEVLSTEGLVEIVFRGQVIATRARKHDLGKAPKLARSAPGRRARAATVGKPVTRLVDSRGAVSFAGTAYQAGHPYRGQTVEVAIVGGNVQLAIDGKVIKTHPIRHDPAKEHRAFANPGGRPPKKQRSPYPASPCRGPTGHDLSSGYRDLTIGLTSVPLADAPASEVRAAQRTLAKFATACSWSSSLAAAQADALLVRATSQRPLLPNQRRYGQLAEVEPGDHHIIRFALYLGF